MIPLGSCTMKLNAASEMLPITLNGFSKTYAKTGWRVGYIAGPKDIINKMTEIRHALSINSCTFSQYGALAALDGPQEEINKMKNEYNERRKF